VRVAEVCVPKDAWLQKGSETGSQTGCETVGRSTKQK